MRGIIKVMAIVIAFALSNFSVVLGISSTYPSNVTVQGDMRDRMIRAVHYLDQAKSEDIWNGLTTGMWSADFPGRTLEAYSRTSLSLHQQSSSRFAEIGEGLLSRQSSDGAFHIGHAANDYDKYAGFWFGNARGTMGLLWAYQYTKDSRYLNAAVRVGNYYMDHYFDVNQPIPHGSFSWVATEAMLQLYKVSKDPNYLSLAKRIADSVPPVNPTSQHTHSYLLSLRGMIQIYEITGATKYLTMVLRQYAYFKDHVIWPGGGIVEHLGDRKDYNLNYWLDEGCSICDWIGLNMDLWRVTRDSAYVDMIERTALNHFIYDQDASGGFCGDRGVDFVREGSPWTACCAMHGTRTLSELTEYIAVYDGNQVYINLFYPAKIDLRVLDANANIELKTDYPITGKVQVKLTGSTPMTFSLNIRIPVWSKVNSLTINGAPSKGDVRNGYLHLQRKWNLSDTIDIEIAMPLRTEARTKFIGDDAQTDYQKVSLWKGPRQLVFNENLNTDLWSLNNPRPALRYVYQTYDQLQFDKSVRNTPLQIGTHRYSKGLGVHSVSEIVYCLAGQFKEFRTDIGVDESVGDSGSVRFKVCVDGLVKAGSIVDTNMGAGGTQALYDIGFTVSAMTGKDPAKTITVDVTGAKVLRLCVDEAVDGEVNDVADWGNARLIRADGSEVYLSDLPDDRALGLPWDYGNISLEQTDSDKSSDIVTVNYHVGQTVVPVRFNYLADLGYGLIKKRPVLNNYMKVVGTQPVGENKSDK
jgi:hypothetical protein